MIKKYVRPNVDIVSLYDDIILTSGTMEDNDNLIDAGLLFMPEIDPLAD